MRLYLYYASFAVGLVLAVLVNMRVGAKNGSPKRDTALFTVAGFIAAVIGAIAMAAIYNAVVRAVSDEPFSPSRVSLYGGLLFMPPLMLLFAKLQKADFGEVTDNCCAGVFMLLGTAKLGCGVYGCCWGVPCEHGLYNAFAGEKVFPVQLLESALTFVIAFVIYRLAVKKHAKGTVYPLGLIFYGVMRFFAQFLRFHEIEAEKDLVGFMDLWQTVSLVAVIVGAVWLAVSLKINGGKADEEPDQILL